MARAKGDEDRGQLAENVTRIRSLRGLSQTDLAHAAGTQRSTVAALEIGRVRNPGVFTLYPIALALRVPMEDLMGASRLLDRDRIRRHE